MADRANILCKYIIYIFFSILGVVFVVPFVCCFQNLQLLVVKNFEIIFAAWGLLNRLTTHDHPRLTTTIHDLPRLPRTSHNFAATTYDHLQLGINWPPPLTTTYDQPKLNRHYPRTTIV